MGTGDCSGERGLTSSGDGLCSEDRHLPWAGAASAAGLGENSLEITACFRQHDCSDKGANKRAYAHVMQGAIAVNGSFFNTHRMVSQYLANAWFRDRSPEGVSGVAQRARASSVSAVGYRGDHRLTVPPGA